MSEPRSGPSQPDLQSSSTLRVTQRHSKRPPAFAASVKERGSGALSSPDLTRAWKPLQMPRIGLPDRANLAQLGPEPGLQLQGQAPAGAQGVAVGEPARQQHCAALGEGCRPFPQVTDGHDPGGTARGRHRLSRLLVAVGARSVGNQDRGSAHGDGEWHPKALLAAATVTVA